MAERKSGFEEFMQPLLDQAGQVYFALEEQKQKKTQLKQAQKQLELNAASVMDQFKRTKLQETRDTWDRAMDITKLRHPEWFAKKAVGKPVDPYKGLSKIYEITKGIATPTALSLDARITESFRNVLGGKVSRDEFDTLRDVIMQSKEKMANEFTTTKNKITGESIRVSGSDDFERIWREYIVMSDELDKRGVTPTPPEDIRELNKESIPGQGGDLGMDKGSIERAKSLAEMQRLFNLGKFEEAGDIATRLNLSREQALMAVRKP